MAPEASKRVSEWARVIILGRAGANTKEWHDHGRGMEALAEPSDTAAPDS